MTRRLPIGISSCLLGEMVRYDGRLKGADALIAALDEQVRWISICPEVGAGLSTPRPPMDLYQTRIGVRMRTLDGAHDVTEALGLERIGWIFTGLPRDELLTVIAATRPRPFDNVRMTLDGCPRCSEFVPWARLLSQPA